MNIIIVNKTYFYLQQFKNEIGFYGEEFIYNIYVIDYKHLVFSVYDVYKKKYDVYLNPEEIITKAKNILKSFPRWIMMIG